MPIKFRCRHCRQFLGISRSQAGEIVNCPQCGKAIRVPDLDGSVAPIPTPKLNLQDEQLADALSELAGLGSHSIQAKTIDISVEPQSAQATEAVLVVPVAEALTPATSLPVSSVPTPSPQRLEVDTDQGTAINEGTHEALRSLAESAVTPRPAIRPDASDNRFWKIAVPVVGALSLLAAVWFLRGDDVPTNAAAKLGQTLDTDTQAPQDDDALPRQQPAADPPALTGRITYLSDTGDGRPDSGATVMLLPQPRTGRVKLDVAGFLSGADDIDIQTAVAALRVLGGDVTAADDDGRYSLRVSAAGDYILLVISHHQARDTSVPIASRLQEMLSDYFFRPSSLLGRLAFQFDDFHYRGQGTSPRDFTFATE